MRIVYSTVHDRNYHIGATGRELVPYRDHIDVGTCL